MKRASSVSVTAMIPHVDPGPVAHGGDLTAARALFPDAPKPFIDLSTGINPFGYPLPPLRPQAFTRLPETAAINRLAEVAANRYGAPSAEHVVPAPGTQILLPVIAALLPPGRAMVLAPTYGEYARVAAMTGHRVEEVATVEYLAEADLAVVVNPNNPDGRIVPKAALCTLADTLRRRGGLLVVDETFMDLLPGDASLVGEAADNVLVLRSFGKFFGLAGLRLGFAIAPPAIAARLSAWLGPWAVSGAAIAVGEIALSDDAWIEDTRNRLAHLAARLDDLLAESHLDVIGGTSLFRLVRTEHAGALFNHLGRAGILVRRFDEKPHWLRFGLPGDQDAWTRLRHALAGIRAR
jgi:cobalamin biosynthesis protein CobC